MIGENFYLRGCNNVLWAPSTFNYKLTKECAKQHLKDFMSGFFEKRLYFVIGTIESAKQTVLSTAGVAMAILLLPANAVINSLSLFLPAYGVSLRNRISIILNPKQWVVTRLVTSTIVHFTRTFNSGIGVLAPVVACGIDRFALQPLHQFIGA